VPPASSLSSGRRSPSALTGGAPRQLSILMYLHGYTTAPAEEFEVAAALPFALEDLEGAA
jgi:hypothetical protein